MFYIVARFLCQWFCLLLFGFRSYGSNRVPPRGPVILASSHQSFLDPILVQVGTSRLAYILARKSLFRNPFFGFLIRSLRAFPIERGTADLSALHTAIDLLQKDNILLMFPEATRTSTGEIGSIQRGVGVIAHRSNAQVVPVAIDGAFECWPRDKAIFRPGPIRVMYGRPIRIASGDRESAIRFAGEIRAQLVEMQAELRRLKPSQ